MQSMSRSEALAQVEAVQRVVEQTHLYGRLPGWVAIFSGVLTLLGCAASYAMINSLDFQAVAALPMSAQFTFGLLWFAIFCVSIGTEVVVGTRAMRGANVQAARRAAWSLVPFVLVAMALSTRFLVDLRYDYIVPMWAMVWGAGIFAAGQFSDRTPRLMGAAFALLGGYGLIYFPHLGLVLAALTFGLLHIGFGAYVVATRKDAA